VDYCFDNLPDIQITYWIHQVMDRSSAADDFGKVVGRTAS
jgi:hypothetical protein